MKSFDAALRALLRTSLITVWIVATAAYVSAAAQPLFEQGNAKYKEGDFKSALQLYKQLVDSGHATSAVYFNMGNAALRAGEKGEALVYYERARKASPRDEDLLWNIRVLKNTLTDRIEDRSHFTLAVLKGFIRRWTSAEAAFLFTALLALVSLLAAASLFSPAVPRSLQRLAWAALVVSAALFALKGWDAKDPRVVVLDREISAHYGPSERETKAFTLHEGADGKVKDESGDWYYVALENGNMGWIRKNSCETV